MLQSFNINMPHQTALCKIGRGWPHKPQQSILCLKPISDFILHRWSHNRTVEMFSEFIINPHPKQCLFWHRDINSQPVMQPQHSRQQPFNLTVPLLRSCEWKLILTPTALWPYAFLQPLSTVWETGSPRPSDNLLFQRTMAGYFPITWDCFCLCMSTIVICISLHFINMRFWTCS